jgi:ABC-2 type transport system permease protein
MNGATTFLMLLRREIWEHRGVVLAPTIIAGLTTLLLLAGLVQGRGLSADGASLHVVRGLGLMSPAQREAALTALLAAVTPLFLITMVILVVFYAADALYSERRDRSILFWKSLPVTDLSTVLAKFCTAAVVIPAVTLLLVAATQLLTLVIASLMVWVGGGEGDAWALVWRPAPLGSLWLLLAYGMLAAALWAAPLIGWLLLASAWARKAPMLWAVLPIVVLGQLELLAFGTARLYSLVAERVIGVFPVAFRQDISTLVQMDGEGSLEAVATERLLGIIDLPGLLAAPALWIGLIVAAMFIAAAVLLRRFRDE